MGEWEQLTFDRLAPLSAEPADAPTSPAKLSKAAQYVLDGLAACLPPGVPLGVTRIIQATLARGKATATVELFDGKQGTVEVSKWTPLYEDAWAIHWLDTGGGALSWNGAAWERASTT